MLIANQKRKENIAEYLLYMFQIEDLIRAYSFDADLLEVNIISKFEQPYHVKRDMREWYVSLIKMMKDGHLLRKGHIPLVRSLIEELESFHIRLLHDEAESKYQSAYAKVQLVIDGLRARSDGSNTGDVELCINGLYGLLMLRLTKKTISQETNSAFGLIGEMVGLLSAKYLQFEKGVKEF
jgi:hypothetical protein